MRRLYCFTFGFGSVRFAVAVFRGVPIPGSLWGLARMGEGGFGGFQLGQPLLRVWIGC